MFLAFQTAVFVVLLSTSSVLCKRHRHREQPAKEVVDEEPKELPVVSETNSYYTVKHTIAETTNVRSSKTRNPIFF
jgi:hypothetical protein